MREKEEKRKNIEHIVLDEKTRKLSSGFKLPRAYKDSMTNFSKVMENYKMPEIYSVSEQICAVSSMPDISNAYKLSQAVSLTYQIPEALSLGTKIQEYIPNFDILAKSELGIPGLSIELEKFNKIATGSYIDELDLLTSKLNDQMRFLSQSYMPKIQQSAFDIIGQRNEIFKPLSQMIAETYGEIVIDDYEFSDDEIEVLEYLDNIKTKEDVSVVYEKSEKFKKSNPFLFIILGFLISHFFGPWIDYPVTENLVKPTFKRIETPYESNNILKIDKSKEIDIFEDGEGNIEIQYYDEKGNKIEDSIDKSILNTYEKKDISND